MSFRVVLRLKAFTDHPPLPSETYTQKVLEAAPVLHQVALGQVRRHTPRPCPSHAALHPPCLTSLHAGGAGCHVCKLARHPAWQMRRSEQLLCAPTALQALGVRQEVTITNLRASRLADPSPPPPTQPTSPSAPLTQQEQQQQQQQPGQPGQPGQQQAPQQAEQRSDQEQGSDLEVPELPASPQPPPQQPPELP